MLHLLWHDLDPENQFFGYISRNTSPRGKLQDTSNIPHKISYMIVSLKVSLGLLGSLKNFVRNHEFNNFYQPASHNSSLFTQNDKTTFRKKN